MLNFRCKVCHSNQLKDLVDLGESFIRENGEFEFEEEVTGNSEKTENEPRFEELHRCLSWESHISDRTITSIDEFNVNQSDEEIIERWKAKLRESENQQNDENASEPELDARDQRRYKKYVVHQRAPDNGFHSTEEIQNIEIEPEPLKGGPTCTRRTTSASSVPNSMEKAVEARKSVRGKTRKGKSAKDKKSAVKSCKKKAVDKNANRENDFSLVCIEGSKVLLDCPKENKMNKGTRVPFNSAQEAKPAPVSSKEKAFEVLTCGCEDRDTNADCV